MRVERLLRGFAKLRALRGLVDEQELDMKIEENGKEYVHYKAFITSMAWAAERILRDHITGHGLKRS